MEAQIYSAFISCHGSLQETIFYLNIECLQRSCCSLETADYEIIFCKNPIQKNLTATFINSSLFQCSQGSYGQLNIAIPLSGFVVYYHYLLLQKKKKKKKKVHPQPAPVLPATTQLWVSKVWQQRQRWGLGPGSEADQHVLWSLP